LVKRPDHVLAHWMIDACLATDRRIHLREQRRRNLDKRHASHVAGGGESCHVTHHPAAKRVHDRLAIAAVLQQRIEDQVERFPILVRLSVREHHPVNG
jgi:hypothetical protein